MLLATNCLQYVFYPLPLKHHWKAYLPAETGPKWKLQNIIWNAEEYSNRTVFYQETKNFYRDRPIFN